jgi:hypothetical protein
MIVLFSFSSYSSFLLLISLFCTGWCMAYGFPRMSFFKYKKSTYSGWLENRAYKEAIWVWTWLGTGLEWIGLGTWIRIIIYPPFAILWACVYFGHAGGLVGWLGGWVVGGEEKRMGIGEGKEMRKKAHYEMF